VSSILALQIADLELEVRDRRRVLDRKVGEARAAASRGKAISVEVQELQVRIQELQHAVTVLTSIGETRQAAAQSQIESLVSRGLQVIFSIDLSFQVRQVQRSSRPEVDFVVIRQVGGSVVETSVMEAGGGLTSVVGFLLRLVVILLSQPKGALLLLDETFGMVSEEYEPRVAEFLRELVDKTGVQVLMVTHSTAFDEAADRRHRFVLQDGQTKVREL
jgi:ABC-type taurine transport system ATPase subunit